MVRINVRQSNVVIYLLYDHKQIMYTKMNAVDLNSSVVPSHPKRPNLTYTSQVLYVITFKT